jgi:hypothetical protein
MKEEWLMVSSKKNSMVFAGYVFLILLMAASITGSSGAWFSSGAVKENEFTMGTLEIDAEGPESVTGFGTEECTVLNYTISSTGSKRAYVRARFEGYWVKTYHRNTAKATVVYNGQTIIASDSAYYSYGTHEPEISLPGGSAGGKYGFTDEVSLPPLKFPPLSVTGSNMNLTITSMAIETEEGQDDEFAISAISDYPEPCAGPLVDPVLAKDNPQYFPGGNTMQDPVAGELPRPDSCSNLYSYKIDLDQSAVINGHTYGDGQIEVTIYKKLIGGKYYFAYHSNFPVYHVYAKGGSDGGNLYMYYPTFPNGVYSDCGLSQPGGDWSHITFYYCVPPDDPSLTIKKYVSVDGGSNWEDADSLPGPVIQPPTAPRFKFVVTNTGNVPLTGIVVTDDYFGSIATIDLAPGASWETIVTDINWEANQQLSTDNVSIKLCDTMTNWQPTGPWPLGTYFYYTQIIAAGGSVPLCVQVCLNPATTGSEYDGAVFTLHAYFEASQVTNGVVDLNWPGHLIY